MDGHSFASLAQLRILLLPVGNISRTSYDRWATLIRSFEHIRLDEITQDTSEDKSRFMPGTMSFGHLHLAYASHPTPAWHNALSLFRLSHLPLGVIGIAECSSTSPLNSVLAEFYAAIEEYFPKGSAFPLASKCYAFEQGDDASSINLTSTSSQMVVIPSVMGNKQLYVGTLIAELCSDILGSFTGLAKALESEAGLEALNDKLLPVISQSEVLSTPTHPHYTFEPRQLSVSPGLSHSNSLTEVTSVRNSADVSMLQSMNGVRPVPKRSATAMPPSTSSSALTAPAAKKRASINATSSAQGRLHKIVADLYLLAGNTADAVQWYMESLPMLKGPQDFVWQASAVEGMCVAEILDSWAAGDGAAPPPGGNKQPWADISERLNQAISLYAKAAPFGSTSPSQAGSAPSDNIMSVLSLLYCQSVFRHAQFLLAVWATKGLGKAAFDVMMLSDLPIIVGPSEGLFNTLSTSTALSRSTISNVISQAHGPHLMHLQPRDCLRVLNNIAAMFAYIGFRRKEAYIFREVLSVVMDMLVTSREDMAHVLTNGNVGLGIKGMPQTPGSSPKLPPASAGTVSVRQTLREEGNESILRLVRHVCEMYGVDLNVVGVTKHGEEPVVAEVGDDSEEPSDHYGWPELQIGVVREAVAIAEALPDYPTVAQFTLSTLKTLRAYLSPSEQAHLHAGSAKALATARRRGDERRVDYWAGKPVLSLEVTPLPLLRLPVEHPMRDLEPNVAVADVVISGRRDPFIYNPRLKSASTSQAIAIQNEPIEFTLTLFNPFAFDLEIPSLTLSTTGLEFKAPVASTVIPSESYRVLRITGTVPEPGILTVRGIKVQLAGGLTREFILPLATDEEDRQSERRKSILDADSVRTKFSGLDARAKKRSSVLVTKAESSFLTCKVVEAQPLLRIRRTTLPHSALMLYDGEMLTVKLTLENISLIPVDFVKTTFDDTTVAAAQQALAEGDLSIDEAYETEWDLIHRPVFAWQGISSEVIGSEKKAIVAVTCLGKHGCTSGSIQLSYSYARRQRETPLDVFHTRQLIYPIEITVYRTLECLSMDVVPYWRTDDSDELESSTDDWRTILNIDNHDDWCLFHVDVKNYYSTPFEVTFDRAQEGVPRASTSRLISPGATARIILPLRRITLPASIVSQAIPTLSNRQFVVAKDKLSSAEEQLQREFFWYREQIFSSVQARWREPGSSRHGDLSIRGQRMSLSMLRAFRSAQCRVKLSLSSEDPSVSVRRKGSKYIAPPYQFLTLRAEVTNTSTSPLPLLLSYIPSSLILLESALFDASLNQLPVGVVDPSGSAELETRVCFVSAGKFDFKAILEVVGEGPIGGVEGNICIIVAEDD